MRTAAEDNRTRTKDSPNKTRSPKQTNKPADGKAETKQISTQWMSRATAQFTVLGLALKEKIIR